MDTWNEIADRLVNEYKDALTKAQAELEPDFDDSYLDSKAHSIQRIRRAIDVLKPHFEEEIKEIIFEWCKK